VCIIRLYICIAKPHDLDFHFFCGCRVLEFIELHPEGDLQSADGKEPPASWPEAGEIKYVDLTVDVGHRRVLNSINLHIQSGEKIGIVGRSGSGKSTLVNALFRLDEFVRGGILIDGLDISQIGLHELRRKLSIIPQNTMTFTGTMRQNCDPGERINDKKIWNALEEVQLDSLVKSLPQGFFISDS